MRKDSAEQFVFLRGLVAEAFDSKPDQAEAVLKRWAIHCREDYLRIRSLMDVGHDLKRKSDAVFSLDSIEDTVIRFSDETLREVSKPSKPTISPKKVDLPKPPQSSVVASATIKNPESNDPVPKKNTNAPSSDSFSAIQAGEFYALKEASESKVENNLKKIEVESKRIEKPQKSYTDLVRLMTEEVQKENQLKERLLRLTAENAERPHLIETRLKGFFEENLG